MIGSLGVIMQTNYIPVASRLFGKCNPSLICQGENNQTLSMTKPGFIDSVATFSSDAWIPASSRLLVDKSGTRFDKEAILE